MTVPTNERDGGDVPPHPWGDRRAGWGPPPYLDAFVGRERDIDAVLGLLGAARLVTLTGPAGVGKSRLAHEVVQRARSTFAGGVAWADVASAGEGADPSSVLAAAAGSAVSDASSPLATVVATVGDRPVLLVVDDCDRLIGPLGTLLASLLDACPRLAVLATTREALGMAGERVWRVDPLSLPRAGSRSVDAVMTSEAGALFVERARESSPKLELDAEGAATVARICERLEGIPLAIELAANRVRVLPLRQIAERLDDAFSFLSSTRASEPARHRTLRTAIEWSYDLLPPGHRALLERLSVFRGGAALEAVEAVCGEPDGPPSAVLDLLGGLVDRSIVRMVERDGEARFVLLESVRVFAASALAASGDDMQRGVALRHARYFAAKVDGAASRLARLEHAPDVVAELALEHGNVLAALERTAEIDPALRLSLAGAVAWHWMADGHWSEGAARLESALEDAPDDVDPRVRGRALSGHAALTYLLGRLDVAEVSAHAAVELWRDLALAEETARSLALLAQVHGESNEPDEGLAYADEAVALAEASGDALLKGWALACRGSVRRTLGRLADADADYVEAEAAVPAEGPCPVWLLEAPLGRAVVALRSDDLAAAVLHTMSALRTAAALGGEWRAARALLAAASVTRRLGDPHRTRRALVALRDLPASGTPLLAHEEATRDELERWAAGAAEAEGGGPARPRSGLRAVLREVEAHLHSIDVDALRRERPGPTFGRAVHAPEAARRTLEVRALGPLEVLVDGEPVPERAWQYAKPRELLVRLLCNPNGWTRDQIGLDFWPDASGRAVKNNFHVAMHRLRRALGGRDAVVLDGGRYRVGPTFVTDFDAEVFEREVTDLLSRRDGYGERTEDERLERALEAYRGDFLEGEDAGDWHLSRRERLRTLHADGLLTVAGAAIGRGEHERAAAMYDRVVVADDLREEAYRGLMRCRLLAGDRSGALRLYRRLVERLRAELGIGPEPETVRLADGLTSADG